MNKSAVIKIKNYRRIYISVAFFVFIFSITSLYLSAEKAKERDNYWITNKSIPLGQIITEKDIELKALDLGVIANRYFKQSESPVGLFTQNSIMKNELITTSNVARTTEFRNVSLKIPNGHLPPTLDENDDVDIWFSDPLTSNSILLLERISVVWVDELNTNFGGVSTVVLAIPQDKVATLIKSSRSDGLDLVQIEK